MGGSHMAFAIALRTEAVPASGTVRTKAKSAFSAATNVFRKFLHPAIEGPFGTVQARDLKRACRSVVNSLMPKPADPLEYCVAFVLSADAPQNIQDILMEIPDREISLQRLEKLAQLLGMKVNTGTNFLDPRNLVPSVELVFPVQINGTDGMSVSLTYTLSGHLKRTATATFNNREGASFGFRLDRLAIMLTDLVSSPKEFIQTAPAGYQKWLQGQKGGQA